MDTVISGIEKIGSIFYKFILSLFPSLFVILSVCSLEGSISFLSEMKIVSFGSYSSGFLYQYFFVFIVILLSFILSSLGELFFEVESIRKEIIERNKAYKLFQEEYPKLKEFQETGLLISLSVPVLINKYPGLTGWIVFHYATYQMLRDIFLALWIVIDFFACILIVKISANQVYLFIQLLFSILVICFFSFLYKKYFPKVYSSNRISKTDNDEHVAVKKLINRNIIVPVSVLIFLSAMFIENNYLILIIAINLVGCIVGYALLWRSFGMGIYAYSMVIESMYSIKFFEFFLKNNNKEN